MTMIRFQCIALISSVAIQEQLARIPRRLRFYEDAAKVVQRRMVPNFKKSFERAVALPKKVMGWLLATLREKLVKIGAKVIRHGRYVTFQMKRHRF